MNNQETLSAERGSLERLVRLLVANHTPEELALGYLRYEAVRKMSPRTFGELHKLNLSGKFFDSLVDEALQSWKQPNNRITDAAPPAARENETDATGRRSRASDDIGINQTNPPAKIHIRCKCGCEITIDYPKEIDVRYDIKCPHCGGQHIAIRSDGSVGIGGCGRRK